MEKVSKEQAIKEIQELVFKHTFENKTDEEIDKDYPQLIKAIVEGKMEIGDTPKFELYSPTEDNKGNVTFSNIEFKTRIKPLDMAALMKGLDMQKDTFTAMIRMHSHLIGKGVNEYNNLSALDLKVVQQICGIFL